MKETIIYLGTCVLVLLIVVSIVYYNNLSPSISSNDIQIEGKITPYDENRFLVELDIVRLKDELADHYIYPIVDGSGNISFIEDEGYYTPGAIGDWWESYEMLHESITEHLDFDADIVGFSIPTPKGEYKTKFTIYKTDVFRDIKALDVYYVHVERRFGKDLNWIMKVTIQVNL
ncbi:hypothetical protein ACP8HI_17350 [Paenibacillus sp. FA6]|uniref:hypothetical protein n=1 Tax=Paenibacillus sp. FA6 TaxID=3413029 RepID=UPI003F65E7FC